MSNCELLASGVLARREVGLDFALPFVRAPHGRASAPVDQEKCLDSLTTKEV